MAERFENIVDWFCCLVAAICFAFGVSVWFLNFREGPRRIHSLQYLLWSRFLSG